MPAGRGAASLSRSSARTPSATRRSDRLSCRRRGCLGSRRWEGCNARTARKTAAVLGLVPVEVDDVPQVVEEGRGWGVGEVGGHRVGNVKLRVGILDAAAVTDGVKREHVGGHVLDNTVKRQSKRERPRGRGRGSNDSLDEKPTSPDICSATVAGVIPKRRCCTCPALDEVMRLPLSVRLMSNGCARVACAPRGTTQFPGSGRSWPVVTSREREMHSLAPPTSQLPRHTPSGRVLSRC